MKAYRASLGGSTQGHGLWLWLLVSAVGCTQAPRGTGNPLPSTAPGTETSVDNAVPADGDDASEEGVPEDGTPVDVAGCEDNEARAAEVLATRCASCHGNGNKNGGFGEALNPDAIVTRGLVVLGDLPGSVLYQVTVSGEMPRNASNLSPQEQTALADWILCEPESGAVPPATGPGPDQPDDVNVGAPADDDAELDDDELHDDEDDDELDDDDDLDEDDDELDEDD